MAINLSDIPNAVNAYLDTHVTSTVSEVDPEVTSSLEPGEEGNFFVTVRNAAAPNGVRLTDIKHHLQIPPITPHGNTFRAKFHVPATPPARATTDRGDPVLSPGSLVSEMFLFPLDPVLEVGDTDTIVNLQVHALSVGDFDILCHVHADVEVDDLLPNGARNDDHKVTTTIS